MKSTGKKRNHPVGHQHGLIVLPLFLTKKLKWPVGLATIIITAIIYSLPNHIHLFTPQLLSMSAIDKMIPFIPSTLWIYLSETLLFATTFYFAKNLKNINKMIYAFLFLQIVSTAIFWFWPTTFPRELFPLDKSSMNNLTYIFFEGLRTVDNPSNCCPSLHVSSCYLMSFLYLNEQKKKFALFFIWTTFIAISTLTTKQHYFIDVATGLASAIAVYFIFFKFISYRKKA